MGFASEIKITDQLYISPMMFLGNKRTNFFIRRVLLFIVTLCGAVLDAKGLDDPVEALKASLRASATNGFPISITRSNGTTTWYNELKQAVSDLRSYSTMLFWSDVYSDQKHIDSTIAANFNYVTYAGVAAAGERVNVIFTNRLMYGTAFEVYGEDVVVRDLNFIKFNDAVGIAGSARDDVAVVRNSGHDQVWENVGAWLVGAFSTTTNNRAFVLRTSLFSGQQFVKDGTFIDCDFGMANSDPATTNDWYFMDIGEATNVVFQNCRFFGSGAAGSLFYDGTQWSRTAPGYHGKVDFVNCSADFPHSLLSLMDNLSTVTAVQKGAATFNLQSGLFEQLVTISNCVPFDISGVLLTFKNLSMNTIVYNADHIDVFGNPIINWTGTIPGNTTKDFRVQYYTSQPGLTPGADVSASLGMEKVSRICNGTPVKTALRSMSADGVGYVMLELGTVPGIDYQILYSDSLTVPPGKWKTANKLIRATSSRTQWIDYGPPVTDNPPSEVKSRFYKAIEVHDD
jgi:hypothetical protein